MEEVKVFFSKNKEASILEGVERQRVTIQDPEGQLAEKLKILAMDERDLQVLKTIQPMIEKNMHLLVQKFYDTILMIPELESIIQKHSSVDRLKGVLFPHLLDLFSGVIDRDFVAKRLQVARVHYVIGLKPAWYLAAFQQLQCSMLHIVQEEVKNTDDWIPIIQSITRILSLEQQLVLEAYELETMQGMEESFKEGRDAIKNQVLDVSHQLLGYAQEAAALIETLLHGSSQVKEISTEGQEKAEQTRTFGIKGRDNLQHMLTKVETIANDIREMNTIVKNVESSSEQIRGVVKIVQEIADQTNLLALNSAIEAARAGEYGRGFAVVAEEVRNLAEQTKDSISTINELVQNSNQYTTELIESLDGVTREVQESTKASEETFEGFKDIIEAMDENVVTNTNIQNEVENQTSAIHNIEQVATSVVESAERLDEIMTNE